MSSVSKRAYLLLLSLFFAVMVNTAWLSDDSLITLRHVLNFINGYGPVFNVDERVQGYTHPIWFLLISFFSLFFNYIYVTYLVSFACSICAIAFLIREAIKVNSASFLKLFVYILLICCSKAFIEFSTSGLENPLSHVLIIVFFIQYFSYILNKDKKLIFSLAILIGLLYLNRMDSILIVLPAFVHLLYLLIKDRAHKHCILFACVIVCPILAWHCFSLIYYGFPFPNTAYAKLATGIEWYSYIKQGLRYLEFTCLIDPITIGSIVVSFLTILNRKDNICPVIGIVLYLLYVIKVGGDFMAGRFFSSIFILSIYLIIRTDYKISKTITKVIFTFVLCLFVLNSKANFIHDEEYVNQYSNNDKFYHGICNERAWYYNVLGFRNFIYSNNIYEKLINAYNNWTYEEEPLKLTIAKALGMYSIMRGPQFHILDVYALVDPLLSKLPIVDIKNFRIGHFERLIPYGYINSLVSSKNLIVDSHIHAYYDMLNSVVRGDLFTLERLKNVLFLNISPIPRDFDSILVVNPENFTHRITDGSQGNASFCVNFNQSTQVEFLYAQEFVLNSLSITTDGNDYYDIYVNNNLLHTISPKPLASGVFTSKIVPYNGPIKSNSILVKAHEGDHMYSVCYINVE